MNKKHKNSRNVISFYRWKNKSYSVFNSIKKVVRIAVLPIAYMITAGTQDVVAQSDTTSVDKTLELEGVVVSASRIPLLYPDVARLLEIVSKEEIELIPASSVADLLEFVPGVDIRQRGAKGVQSDLNIRGGSSDQSILLLNGVNISDPQTGHHNFNLPVNLEAISKIEILNGPAARVYGPNAFSGAINLITIPTDTTNLSLSASYGQHGFLNTNVVSNIAYKNSRSLISGSFKQSDGYRENTDFKTGNIFYFGNLKTKIGELDLQSGYINNSFGANSFYTAKYPNQYEQVKTTFASAKFQSNNSLHLTPLIYWRQNRDRFELFRDNPASWYSGHNYHKSETAGASLNSYLIFGKTKISFGLEYRFENIKSNVLGNEMSKPIAVQGESNAFYTKKYQRDNYSGFLEYNLITRKISLSAGVMAFSNSDLNNRVEFFPGLDFSYKFSRKIYLFASLNKTLRMPSFTDMFYQGPTNIGNPELKPEEAISYELGVKMPSKIFKGDISLFYRSGTNIIDWIKLNENDPKWQCTNFTTVNSYGLNSSFLISFEEISPKNPVKYLQFGYSYIGMEKESYDYISNYVLDYLKHNFTLSTDIRIYKKIRTSWAISYKDRDGEYIEYKDNNYANAVEYKPFFLINTSLYYQTNSWKVFMEISNLLDKTYYDYGNLPSPGIWVNCGFKITI